MNLRIRSYRDVEIGNTLQTRNEVRGVGEAVSPWNVMRGPLRGIAPERYQVANSLVPVLPRDVEDFATARADARQVRCTDERRLALHSCHNIVSALASRAVCSVGYGNKTWRERCEPLNRLPQRRFHFGIGRR